MILRNQTETLKYTKITTLFNLDNYLKELKYSPHSGLKLKPIYR